ncbi:hypothetical protein ACFL17_05700 [Pseudomonadota bacterium]
MRNLFVYLVLLSLAACGGGSSSGGGSTSTNSSGGAGAQTSTSGGTPSSPGGSTQTTPINQFSGVYKGTVTATVTVAAPPFSATQSESVTITIKNDGTVSVVSGSFKWNGKLNGNSFSVSVPGTITQSGITCKGIISVNASISGSTISGPVKTSNLNCGALSVKITGNLAAKKT